MTDTDRISVADAARQLGMNPGSLRRAARTGRLVATLDGDGNRATYHTTMQAVQDYLDSRPDWVGIREARRER